MTINSRAKGATAEREFASIIVDWSGVRLIRNLEQSRSGGHDLTVHPDEIGATADAFRQLAIECKRYGKTTPALIKQWWQQTIDQAESMQLCPVLAYRADRQDWQVRVPLHLINPDHSQSLALDSTATLSIAGFCAVVRERVSESTRHMKHVTCKSEEIILIIAPLGT